VVAICASIWWARRTPVEPPTAAEQALLPTSGLANEAELPVEVRSDWQQVDNPAADGWTIEVLAERAKQMLVQWGHQVFADAAIDAQAIERQCDAAFQATRLLPDKRAVLFRDAMFLVEHAEDRAESPDGAPMAYHGPDGGAAALQDLATFWSPLSNRRFEVKVYRAREEQGELVTHQIVAARGQGQEGAIEQHATWVVHWTRSQGSDDLRVRQIELIDFEQTTLYGSDRVFADVTAAVLGQNDCYSQQLLYGMNYWLDRTQELRYFSPLGNPGLAVGDVNGDGRDDLYLCQEANLPNRLFLQQADGTAREVAAEWQVDWLEGSRSALLVDLDNDGDQDLVVAILGGVVIASNEGDHFVVRDVLPTHDDTTSLTAADYDADGDLDLYVCVDYPNDFFASASQVPVQGGAANRVYHDANNAGRNSLFRNESPDWKFVDVTAETGLDQHNHRFSWAACWEDFDNDGDQDLYVANDFGRNNLYANQDGHFTDIAAQVGAEDSASGMSAAWGDVNRDGRMDLYVGNMFSSAGGRITYQPEFKPAADEQVRQRLQRFARGSTLLLNRDDGQFEDVSVQANVTVGRWAWSSNFVDLNNDGWQDIAVANGYITSDDTGDL
jgi:hypothetical protein